MKDIIEFIGSEIKKAVQHLKPYIIKYDIEIDKINPNVEKNKNIKNGDFSSNVAMTLGVKREDVIPFAKAICEQLPSKYFKKATVAGPGFINLELNEEFSHKVLVDILTEKENFCVDKKGKTNYEIEFVSANPTGLLHIGHARNAAIGDTLARIWEANGINVTREYYINDAGNQIEKLGMSVLIRYKQLFDLKDELPEDSYHGSEIIDVAKALKQEVNNRFVNITYNENGINDPDIESKNFIKDFSKNYLLNVIKDTLNKFGVHMDIWFPESFLYKEKLINKTIEALKDQIYAKDQALWLKTTKHGDDKDRVIVKSDGSYTYFLPDIAYHNLKLSRGYDKCFNIWGSDHMSYAERIKIAMQLFGYSKDQLVVLIMQMVRLIKDGKEFKMSKRSGNSLTLSDLIETIGKDAARWYLVSQPMATHLEIDINKALSKNNDNPLYYVQYAHARINQLLNKREYGMKREYDIVTDFSLLTSEYEKEIINQLLIYSRTLKNIAKTYEVNKLTLYLYNLAKAFHSFYANSKIIDDTNETLSRQRYWLCVCVKQVITNGLKLMSIEPLDKM